MIFVVNFFVIENGSSVYSFSVNNMFIINKIISIMM